MLHTMSYGRLFGGAAGLCGLGVDFDVHMSKTAGGEVSYAMKERERQTLGRSQ